MNRRAPWEAHFLSPVSFPLGSRSGIVMKEKIKLLPLWTSQPHQDSTLKTLLPSSWKPPLLLRTACLLRAVLRNN